MDKNFENLNDLDLDGLDSYKTLPKVENPFGYDSKNYVYYTYPNDNMNYIHIDVNIDKNINKPIDIKIYIK